MSRISRLLIVDPSLRDNVGHHAEYDRAIVGAANAEGLAAQVLAHKEVGERLESRPQFVPVFSRDAWDGARVSMDRDIAAKVLLFRLLQIVLLVPLFAELVRTAAKVLARWKAPKRHTPDLASRAAPRALAGLASLAAFLAERIRVPRFIAFILLRNPRFFFELRKALTRASLGESDLVFAHMLLHSNLLEFAHAASGVPRGPRPQFVLLLRYPVDFYRPRSFRGRLALRILERAFEQGKVRLSTDSERLAAEFARYTHLPFEVLPIPHTEFAKQVIARPARPPSPLRVGSLGNARAEKGFVEILQATRLLDGKSTARPLQFVLQANDPDGGCSDALRDFLADLPDNVEVHPEALGSEEYKALVSSLDVVLVPYWQEVYESRTSGIFLEAVAAGKPVIATEDTWMSDQLSQGCGGIAVPSRQPERLAAAIVELCADIESYRGRALIARAQWLRRHSAPALLRQLVRPARAEGRMPRTAVVVFPWPTLFTRQTGASLRSSLLVDFLREHGWQVTALISSASTVTSASGVRTVLYPDESLSPRANWPFALYVTAKRLATLGKIRPVEWLFFMHRHWHRSRSFKRALNIALAHADAVFVEYTFLASVAQPFARARHIPLVVTAHDVLANQVPDPRWRAKLLELEVESLKQADLAVSVSPTDRHTFKGAGASTVLVPNSVSDPICLDANESEALLRSAGVRVGEAFLVFFGSLHRPNVKAKQTLKEIARRLSVNGTAATVVVAGACTDRSESAANFIALGTVDERTKAALYREALAVLNPMSRGTGTSLKVIEAMSYGKVVLGTGHGFRGYPVEHMVNSWICDDAGEYPNIIRRLLGDRRVVQQIGENAKIFAQRYHYRKTYKPYLELHVGKSAVPQYRVALDQLADTPVQAPFRLESGPRQPRV